MMHESLGRRVWRAALTGLPFGLYKMGFGWWQYHHDHPTLGLIFMIWGGLDIVLNVLSVGFPERVGWCLLASFGRFVDRILVQNAWEKVLLAVDTVASFTVVSIMVWLGRLPLAPSWAAICWNAAVVGNILSVGLEQLYRALIPDRARAPA